MKKKLLSFLLIVMLCCSAVYIFAGCSGNNVNEPGTMSLVTEETWTFKVDENAGTKSNKQILTEKGSANNQASKEFKIKISDDNEEIISLGTMLQKGASVTGLDITRVHEGTLTITYGEYTCRVSYSVTE